MPQIVKVRDFRLGKSAATTAKKLTAPPRGRPPDHTGKPHPAISVPNQYPTSPRRKKKGPCKGRNRQTDIRGRL